MLRNITIRNYKSIVDLDLDCGRVNLIIGENGCGKSNILEALTLASAAASSKLDNEFLTSRGVRVTKSDLMRSAFDRNDEGHIFLSINSNLDSPSIDYKISNDNQNYSKWEVSVKDVEYLSLNDTLQKVLAEQNEIRKTIDSMTLKTNEVSEEIKSLNEENHLEDLTLDSNDDIPIESTEKAKKRDFIISTKLALKDSLKKVNKLNDLYTKNYDSFMSDHESREEKDKQLSYFRDFLIFSPENTALRNFFREGQIEPLGINGEGLLKLLKYINDNKPDQMKDIIENLGLFNWFDSFDIPETLDHENDKILITDRFLEINFDQRSANEGFLFVLFYTSLIVSDKTPKIFAIDNIDASLNPRLCCVIMKIISKLAKKYDKQVFLTTHNPAILDGLNLNDDEERLFIASRKKSGHTRIKRLTVDNIPDTVKDNSLRLSEAFLRGYIGGLPKGI